AGAHASGPRIELFDRRIVPDVGVLIHVLHVGLVDGRAGNGAPLGPFIRREAVDREEVVGGALHGGRVVDVLQGDEDGAGSLLSVGRLDAIVEAGVLA